MMNPPALWYMCKYCMTPFYNLSDLNIHKQWFHPHAHSLPEQGCTPTTNQIDQFGHANQTKPNDLCTTNEDKKFKHNSTEKHDYKSGMKIDEKHKDVGHGQQYYLKPEIGIKRYSNSIPNTSREDAFQHNSNHHPHTSTDYQNYSALSFDLSMLKQKTDPMETIPISELDAFFSKEQINQLACPRNLSPPKPKAHNNVEHHLSSAPSTSVKKGKKKKLQPPKIFQTYPKPEQMLPPPPPQPVQKPKRKSGGKKSRKAGETFSCCFCEAKFDDIEKLRIHELDEGLHFDVGSSRSQTVQPATVPIPIYGLPVPGPDNLYRCRYCTKQVAHRWSLIRHERKHTGEKRFRCQYCQKPIDDKCALQIHERTHTGERPYKCQHCDATFARRSSTKRHELAHIGIKPKSYPRRRR